MATGSLPSEGKKLWESVYDKALKGSCDGDKECAAGSAWKAVKNAGWEKEGDKWVKRAVLQEFGLRIEKASYDKATNERRFRAVASDTEDDLRKDNMTLELFKSFIEKIESRVEAPPIFTSKFWKGGMPYISISHYDDLDGDAVPGDIESVYIDGKYLKSRGVFSDNELGRACFEAVCEDLYGSSQHSNKIRISIGFVDWKHKHKSNGYMFERKSLEDMCPYCFEELITGEKSGLEFLDGQLVHLALTRVPANPRTMMEVEKSMTTQKEDAASIVGEDKAEELEQKSQQVTKADFLVTKMEDEKKPMKGDEEEDDEEEMKDKKMKKSEAEELKAEISELKSLITGLTTKSEPEGVSHPLDETLAVLKTAYDQAIKASGVSSEDKLRSLQQPFEQLGSFLTESIRGTETPEQKEQDAMAKLSEAITALNSKVDLLATQLSTKSVQSPVAPNIPQRRQIDPAVLQQHSTVENSGSIYNKDGKLNLKNYVRKSVFQG